MRKHSRKAVVLVTVLWVSVILTIIVASVGRTHRVDTKVSVFTGQQRRCAWVARAGIETALAIFQLDDTSSDSLDELWSDNDEDFNNVSLGGCILTIKVTDESGKLNINTATREQLMGLQHMKTEIADAILDWRDKDDQPKEEGVESGYYEQRTYGHRIRNGPFRTVRELLLVKGVDENLFYGEDTNFNGLLDENERDGEERMPMDDRDSELDRGWLDYVTCYSYDWNRDAMGQQRVNINEADEEDLEEKLGISTSHAKWIVNNRNNNYNSIGDLINNNSPKEAPENAGSNEQPTPLDLETYKSIVDKICITNDNRVPGRVNVNTAPREVLVALLGNASDAEERAENILTHRAGLAYGMSTIGDLLNVSGMDVGTFKKIANQVTVRSPVFTIRSVAQASQTAVSGATFHYEAVVDRRQDPPGFLYRYQGAGY